MRAVLPRTLFGQTLALLVAGIGLALAAGAWIYSSARQEAVRAVGALAAVERIVNLTRLVADVPLEWRERIVAGTNDPAFRVSVSAERPRLGGDAEPAAAAAIAEMLREALVGREVAVSVHSGGRGEAAGPVPYRSGPQFGPAPGRGPGYGGGMGPGFGPHMMGPGAVTGHRMLGREAMSWRSLEASVGLGNGQWLTFSTTLPDTGPALSPRSLLALLVSAAIIVTLTAFAVRRATSPLRVLSEAAERLGRNVEASPLPLTGTIETQRASAAFNEMQSRLRRLIENRTLMLAAISHDLRTELTLLKLRAETVEPLGERERLLASIGEMEGMLTATLSFARDEAANEAVKRTDIGALAASVVDDLADAGRPVSMTSSTVACVAEVKVVALKRALTNLIENAVKYGGSARVSLTSDAQGITLGVDDDGPGIPEDQLTHVLKPFVRLEGSRNRETGGVGLGLAIAASVAEAHGGTLRLANRPEGGLSASLILPAASPGR